MANTLEEIAQRLQNSNKKTQLIYAFNGTGKTRLSKTFKELFVPKNTDDISEELEFARTKILYYNAFTEDLFYWDNDLEFDKTPKLKIQPNSFTEWIFKEQGQDQNIISFFQYYTDEKLMPHFNNDFTEVTFSFKRGNQEEEEKNIKISKGEESNFIWSIFYALLKNVVSVLNIPEQEDRDTNQFDSLEYVYIDDPVSSLDENHLIELAVDLSQLIKSSNSEIQFIISTHNPLFYNVLYNELKKPSTYMLNKLDNYTFELNEKNGDSNTAFSYHIYLISILKQAVKENNIQKYHFTLLRNLYEKTSRFLGYDKWSEILPNDKKNYENRIIHFHSHKTLSNEEIPEPTEAEKQTINFLLEHLINNYNFYKDGDDGTNYTYNGE